MGRALKNNRDIYDDFIEHIKGVEEGKIKVLVNLSDEDLIFNILDLAEQQFLYNYSFKSEEDYDRWFEDVTALVKLIKAMITKHNWYDGMTITTEEINKMEIE